MFSIVCTSDGWVVRYESAGGTVDSEPFARMLDATARLAELEGTQQGRRPHLTLVRS